MVINLFIACDQNYYSTWALGCIKSVLYYNPDIRITVLIVNPKEHEKLESVSYHYEKLEFLNKESEISYYQSVRFLKILDLFSFSDLVFSIDCDTVCTSTIPKDELEKITKNISVLKHHKNDRWMAGLVSYGNLDFRKRLKEELFSKPIDQWRYGWDQVVLNQLSSEFKYEELTANKWMSFGKGSGYFLTLKGDQKTNDKYLKNYRGIINGIT